MSESRSVFRYRTQRPAKIFPKDGGAIECQVRDLSTKGARLEVAEEAKVPDDFFLIIKGSSERFRCHRVWQIGTIIGVEYF
jgi:PilZ domain